MQAIVKATTCIGVFIELPNKNVQANDITTKNINLRILFGGSDIVYIPIIEYIIPENPIVGISPLVRAADTSVAMAQTIQTNVALFFILFRYKRKANEFIAR